jgi:hypothetical protein
MRRRHSAVGRECRREATRSYVVANRLLCATKSGSRQFLCCARNHCHFVLVRLLLTRSWSPANLTSPERTTACYDKPCFETNRPRLFKPLRT